MRLSQPKRLVEAFGVVAARREQPGQRSERPRPNVSGGCESQARQPSLLRELPPHHDKTNDQQDDGAGKPADPSLRPLVLRTLPQVQLLQSLSTVSSCRQLTMSAAASGEPPGERPVICKSPWGPMPLSPRQDCSPGDSPARKALRSSTATGYSVSGGSPMPSVEVSPPMPPVPESRANALRHSRKSHAAFGCCGNERRRQVRFIRLEQGFRHPRRSRPIRPAGNPYRICHEALTPVRRTPPPTPHRSGRR